MDGDDLRGGDQGIRVVGVVGPERVQHLAIGVRGGHTFARERDGEREALLGCCGDEGESVGFGVLRGGVGGLALDDERCSDDSDEDDRQDRGEGDAFAAHGGYIKIGWVVRAEDIGGGQINQVCGVCCLIFVFCCSAPLLPVEWSVEDHT